MTRAPSRALLALVLVSAAVGCTSPEASRTRGGGPGADPGNRSGLVRMHEGSWPYHETPRVLTIGGSPPLEPARQAQAVEGRRR